MGLYTRFSKPFRKPPELFQNFQTVYTEVSNPNGMRFHAEKQTFKKILFRMYIGSRILGGGWGTPRKKLIFQKIFFHVFLDQKEYQST